MRPCAHPVQKSLTVGNDVVGMPRTQLAAADDIGHRRCLTLVFQPGLLRKILYCCERSLPTRETSLWEQLVVRRGISQRLNGVIHSMKVSMFVVAALVAASGSACAESGIASSYSTQEQGTRTSSGRALHDGALTAAHKTLPFGSRVRVTNRTNGRSVVVTITDRGPFVRGRVIDLTPAGARAIGLSGLARVTLDKS
jgi:rare lipoprotein A